MRLHNIILRLALVAAVVAPARAIAQMNDGIFAAAEAAKKTIDFDGRGFTIRGKRTFIASGTIHYARVPRELWRDRLLRLKRAGLNTVETYAFWNFHETQKGKWDFTGEKDFGAFLDTARDLGLYVIVRVGPYVCAEWDSGGFPVWLRFEPGVVVRSENPAFEKFTALWFEKIFKIVTPRQIHRGGSVALVQLENEHPSAWGTAMPNGYFTRLRDKALSLGLEVPYFFSGLHHGHDPAGDKPWDSAGRKNPWLTTEFWPGWYDLYGPLNNKDLNEYDRNTWKILAFGGAGYNYYMFHGGTNLGPWNDNDLASSYDYGGAVGEAGDVRPIYHRMRRAAWFARSFASVLAGSVNADRDVTNLASGKGLRIFGRKSDAGMIAFLDNPTASSLTATVGNAGKLQVGPGEIAPVLKDVELGDGIKVTASVGRIFGVAREGKTTTLVMYGPEGSGVSVSVVMGGQSKTMSNTVGAAPLEQDFTVATYSFRLVVLATALADQTYFAETKGGMVVVTGASFVAAASHDKQKWITSIERIAGDEGLVYGWGDGAAYKSGDGVPLTEVASVAPALTGWQFAPAAAEAAPAFNDKKWLAHAASPPPMGADGDAGAYAWYRTTVNVPAAGSYTLVFAEIHDIASVFVNGTYARSSELNRRAVRVPQTLRVELPAGNSTLAVFTGHYGRPKFFNYLGSLMDYQPKGLAGAVTVVQGESRQRTEALKNWQMKPGRGDQNELASLGADGWKPVPVGEDVFARTPGFMWFRTKLDEASLGGRAYRVVSSPTIDDRAVYYLNGKMLHEQSPGMGDYQVDLTPAWKESGPNVLYLLVEDVSGRGGFLSGVPQLITVKQGEPAVGTTVGPTWRMHGGVQIPRDGWKPLPAGDHNGGPPAFYRATFKAPDGAPLGHPVLRLSLGKLFGGFAWLNGKPLGRYPQVIKVDGLYLPEPWIRKGNNEVVVFDEHGRSPVETNLVVETAASRLPVVTK